MENLYFPELDAHLCYHDLPGEEPDCVSLHGLGAASATEFRVSRAIRSCRLPAPWLLPRAGTRLRVCPEWNRRAS